MSFTQSVATCLRKYVVIEGRARRSEFWWFQLFQFLVYIVFGLMAGLMGLSQAVISGISSLLGLAFFLPNFTVTVRRLHDVGRSGWWIFILFTIIGIIPYVYWIIKAGDAQANEYGPPV